MDEWKWHIFVASLENEWYAAGLIMSWPLTSGRNFGLDIWRSTWVSYDSPEIDKHNGNKIVSLEILRQKLVNKQNMCVKIGALVCSMDNSITGLDTSSAEKNKRLTFSPKDSCVKSHYGLSEATVH